MTRHAVVAAPWARSTPFTLRTFLSTLFRVQGTFSFTLLSLQLFVHPARLKNVTDQKNVALCAFLFAFLGDFFFASLVKIGG